jgi:multidrug efflux pump subunit AcrA (membrane-fusion protein)
MFRKVVVPIVAALGLALAVFVVMQGSKAVPAAAPVTQPAPAPFASYVAGAGLIESSTENIAIGTGVGGTVTDVYVKIGDRVKVGDPLCRIRDKTLRAELKMQQAAVETARARIADAKAAKDMAAEQLKMYESVPDKRAIIEEEMIRRKFASEGAVARYEQAKADFEVAQAQVEVTAADLDRHTIKSTIDGTVLQVKIHAGEYATAGVPQTPLMVLGDVDTLHVRVDIDENDAWRLDTKAPAKAFVRGNKDLSTPLKFVRVEPYVVPKRSLTGESTERVDTRVLQTLYSFKPGDLPVYVGQQMDVFIEAPPISGAK